MRKLTTEEFIEKAKLVHGNKYDYNESHYVKSNIKIIIKCDIHGNWEQTPASHLMGCGCPKCGNITVANKRKLSLEEFIEKASKLHNTKYTYNKVLYIDNHTKVKIICPLHGEFEQNPADHLSFKGCPRCANNQNYTNTEFIQRAVEIHGLKYSYIKTKYTHSKKKVIITCATHGDFEQQPNNHINGKGCPACGITGFDQTKSAILYYLKITTDEGKVLYKIGITNRTVNERFNLTELSKIEIIKQEEFEVGTDALNKETKLKRKYKEFQYKGPNILVTGNTELFTKNLLE